MELSQQEQSLLEQLSRLQAKLAQITKEKYKRLNPFYEDIFSWHERAKLWIGDEDKGVTVYNSATLIGDVEIGEKTWIGPFTMLDGSGGLTIGRYCSISTGVQIFSHDTVKWALSGGIEQYDKAPVKIGNCCFIGAQSIILRGVSIGDHCLIGAGSVVNKDLPDFSIAVGVPAKIVGHVRLNNGHVNLDWFNDGSQISV